MRRLGSWSSARVVELWLAWIAFLACLWAVYVAAAARGRSVGRRLLEHLIKDSERHGFWTLQAGIFPENLASVGGRWRDVLMLERRSPTVGSEA